MLRTSPPSSVVAVDHLSFQSLVVDAAEKMKYFIVLSVVAAAAVSEPQGASDVKDKERFRKFIELAVVKT